MIVRRQARNINGTHVLAARPWPANSHILGRDTGLGARAAGAATRALFEAYVLGHGVIRGDGATVREAESDAWTEYQRVFGPEILRTGETSVHPWPEGTYLQGGSSGLVFAGAGGARVTAFVEAFPREPNTFIRGEGATVAEADDDAWAKYQRFSACDGHAFEAGKYRNGAGHCSKCRMFGSKVFTPEQLGLFCAECRIPTYYSQTGDRMLCEDHAIDWRESMKANLAAGVPVSGFERLMAGLEDEDEETDRA
jgi:hypothetical protein